MTLQYSSNNHSQKFHSGLRAFSLVSYLGDPVSVEGPLAFWPCPSSRPCQSPKSPPFPSDILNTQYVRECTAKSEALLQHPSRTEYHEEILSGWKMFLSEILNLNLEGLGHYKRRPPVSSSREHPSGVVSGRRDLLCTLRSSQAHCGHMVFMPDSK